MVAQVLQLAQLVELHRMAEVQVGPRRVEAFLDPQRLAAGELGDELALDQQFVCAALENGKMVGYIDGHGGRAFVACASVRPGGPGGGPPILAGWRKSGVW